jgi:hypothetical protein
MSREMVGDNEECRRVLPGFDLTAPHPLFERSRGTCALRHGDTLRVINPESFETSVCIMFTVYEEEDTM